MGRGVAAWAISMSLGTAVFKFVSLWGIVVSLLKVLVNFATLTYGNRPYFGELQLL
jgi:hypothetical protein